MRRKLARWLGRPLSASQRLHPETYRLARPLDGPNGTWITMKTPLKRLLRALGLVVLFSAPNLASAYYDPGVQRWINRDPEGESPGLNLFGFVSGNPVSHRDAFGLQSVPAAPSPRTDTCNQHQRQQIQAAFTQACDRMHKPCSNFDCLNVIGDGAQGCKKKPKVECARPGDGQCANGYCAYTKGAVITVCPGSAFPSNGQNCPGNGGPTTLDCILAHELQHVGAKGRHPDDANKLQQCVGCPYGQPHRK